MTLILFAISMFGNLSALHVITKFRTRALISSQDLTKIGTGSCVAMIFAAFYFAREPLFAFFFINITIIFLIFLLHQWERRQIDSLKKQVPEFLDRWILNMKLGQSMSAARAAALSDLDFSAARLLEPLFLNSNRSPKNHLLLDEKLLRELLNLSQATHSTLMRLENLRDWIRKSENFRRKSGQAMRQASFQSSILVILLIALAVFTIQQHGWRKNSDLIVTSVALTGLGVFTLRHLSRKSRWKI